MLMHMHISLLALFQNLSRFCSLVISTLACYFVLGQPHAESAVLLLLAVSQLVDMPLSVTLYMFAGYCGGHVPDCPGGVVRVCAIFHGRL